MGFLDKLLGRTKDTAGDVGEKAAPVVDKAEEAADQTWDKAKDVADDATEKLGGEDDVTHAADAASDAADDATGPGPTAA